LLLLLGGCTPLQRPLDRRLRDQAARPGAPLASLVVITAAGDQITCSGAWGYRRIDAAQPQRSLPATLNTKYRVASITKLVTALGALRLVDEGKLQLDGDISAYLGFRLRNPSWPDRPITARMLLSHTSSLRDAGFYTVPLPHTLADLFSPAGAHYAGGAHFAGSRRDANSAPGHYFTYANLNFGVLATAMEGASGERFDRLMRRLILHPLGIDGGYTPADLSVAGRAQVAALYTRQNAQGVWDPGGPWVAQYDKDGPTALPDAALLSSYRPGTNATVFSPHAGLRISALDLAKVVQLLLDEGRYAGRQVIAPATLRRLWAVQWRYDPQRDNGDTGGGLLYAWGLGVQQITGQGIGLESGLAGSEAIYWGHRGEAYGFLGGLWVDPQHRRGFVYLAGGMGDDPLRHPGRTSAFNEWEETIQAALLQERDCWQQQP